MITDKELEAHFARWHRKQLPNNTQTENFLDLESGVFVFINTINAAKQSPKRPITKSQKRKLELLAIRLQDLQPYTKNALALAVSCRLLSDPPFATCKTFGTNAVNTLKDLILQIYDQTEKTATAEAQTAVNKENNRETDAPFMALCGLRLSFPSFRPRIPHLILEDRNAEDLAFKELAEIALLAFDSVTKKYQSKIIAEVMDMDMDQLRIKTKQFPAEN
jgi:hypothetical protein